MKKLVLVGAACLAALATFPTVLNAELGNTFSKDCAAMRGETIRSIDRSRNEYIWTWKDGDSLHEQFHNKVCVMSAVFIPNKASVDYTPIAMKFFKVNFDTSWELYARSWTDAGDPQDSYQSPDGKVIGDITPQGNWIMIRVAYRSWFERHDLFKNYAPREHQRNNKNDGSDDQPLDDDDGKDNPKADM